LYAANPFSSLKSVEIYLYRNDEQFGPYSLDQIQAFVDTGSFSPIDSAWFEGSADWTTISQIPGVVISEEKLRQHLVPPFEAYTGDKPYVFVSYAHADGQLVFREIKKLHEAGYRIWYDEGIEPGNDWPEHIAKAVVDCSLFLMFTSPRSAASENCRNEVNLALNRKKKFLAIYLEDTELPLGLELRMGDLQAILKFKMPETTYRKKVFAGMEKLLGPDGRDLSEGEDLVAEVMAVEDEPDFLQAPVDASGAMVNVTSGKSSKPISKLPRRSFSPVAETPEARGLAHQEASASAKAKRLWIAGGVVAAICLVWLLSSLLSDDYQLVAESDDAAPDPTGISPTLDEMENPPSPGKGSPTTARFSPGKPWTVPTASIEMLWCKPGTFTMGNPPSYHPDDNEHRVTLTKGFYLGKYEVTQAQWKTVMGTSPSEFKGDDRPVEKVNWQDAVTFCEKLTERERKAGRLPRDYAYQLPTEAQWEYACRAGTTTLFAFGDSLSSDQANVGGSKLKRTTDVGSYQPNPWGFFDMHGNVQEWVAELLGAYPVGPRTDPIGPTFGLGHNNGWAREWRVIRGGSWLVPPRPSHMRGACTPGPHYNEAGFRVSLQQTRVPQPKMPTPGRPWTAPLANVEMLWCPPGTFTMGSPKNEKNRGTDETQRQVTLTKGFHLGKYEVAQVQWKKIMGKNPSYFKGTDLPVERVSWEEVTTFCQKLTLSEREAGRLPAGYAYQLPTEAQWEYACRAGTTTVFAFGDSLSSKQANFKGTIPYGGAAVGPNHGKPVAVGSYQPNAWGFHDMHGNLWELVADWHGAYPANPVTDPKGSASGSRRVWRGGPWIDGGHYQRSAQRSGGDPGYRDGNLGFRLCLQQKK